MATFTITAAQNIDALTAKTGGDIYNINGGILTIDQDTRVGLNQSTSSTLGNVTVSATLGGTLNIDGRYIRYIPFDTGSGTVPAWNTTISQGGASGLLIGVYSALTVASTATGAAMPASGYLKIKQWNGTAYASGALTGISANATGVDTVGVLELSGDESSGIVANGLGDVNLMGAWYKLGTTSGVSNQTVQIPNSGTLRYGAGVFIERYAPASATYTWASDTVTVTRTAHGFIVGNSIEIAFTTGGATASGSYLVTAVNSADEFTIALTGSGTAGNCTVTILDFYHNMGLSTTCGTEAERGKVCWIDNTGLVRLGNSGAATNGYTPAAGLAIYIGNILCENNTTAARTATVIPNATTATRFDFTTTNSGVVNIDKTNLAWFPSFTQAYSVGFSNSGVVDAINISEIGSPMAWVNVGTGKKPTTELVIAGLTMSSCFEGGTFNNCVFSKGTSANTTATMIVSDSSGFEWVDCRFQQSQIRSTTGALSLSLSRLTDSTFTRANIIQSMVYMTTCINVNMYDTTYVDCISGTTVTTYSQQVWQLGSLCKDIILSGLTFPLTNCHPYTALFTFTTGGGENIKMRNIGTYASPLNMGTVNACGYIYQVPGSANAVNCKFQRIYCTNLRTGIQTTSNDSKTIIEENVFGDYPDSTDLVASNDMLVKGRGTVGTYTAQTAVYGTHWYDTFTTASAGRLNIMMNKASTATGAQVTLANGAKYTGAGSLYMPTVGDAVTFTMPYYCIGHTGFSNNALVMAGGTVGNYRFEYAIDINDGNGFSAMSASSYTAAALGTALSGISTIDATLGFKLKLQITTTTANSTAITSVYMPTTSTTTTQAYQYPLDTVTINVTVKDAVTLDPVEDARVIIEAAAGGYLPAADSVTLTRSGSTVTVTHTSHGMSDGQAIIIRGANEDEYNGRQTITNVSTNSYDYTIAGTPSTPATGTITCTAEILRGTTTALGVLTDSSFELSATQPVTGKVRRATTGTKYKTGQIIGTITTDGFDTTVLLIADE